MRGNWTFIKFCRQSSPHNRLQLLTEFCIFQRPLWGDCAMASHTNKRVFNKHNTPHSCRNKPHQSTWRGRVMFGDCNAFVAAMGVCGRRWRCWADILFQSRFPPWFLVSPTNLALGSVHYTALYSPSVRASLPSDWRSHQNPREKSLTFPRTRCTWIGGSTWS